MTLFQRCRRSDLILDGRSSFAYVSSIRTVLDGGRQIGSDPRGDRDSGRTCGFSPLILPSGWVSLLQKIPFAPMGFSVHFRLQLKAHKHSALPEQKLYSSPDQCHIRSPVEAQINNIYHEHFRKPRSIPWEHFAVYI